MRKILILTALLAAGAVAAHADLLEVSGFGAYTTVGMKDVNHQIDLVKNNPGATVSDLSNGYEVGLDVRTGLLIPIPFLEVGLRAEYVGVNPADLKYSQFGIPVEQKIDPSLINGLIGLSFGMNLPMTNFGIGAGIYGGYGQGVMQTSYQTLGTTVTDYYSGGAFVGEGEIRVNYKVFSILNVYALGGYRIANLPDLQDSAKQKLGAANVDFSGATGGLGIKLDF